MTRIFVLKFKATAPWPGTLSLSARHSFKSVLIMLRLTAVFLDTADKWRVEQKIKGKLCQIKF